MANLTSIFRLLFFIATILPFLAPKIKKLKAILLEQFGSTEEILQYHLTEQDLETKPKHEIRKSGNEREETIADTRNATDVDQPQKIKHSEKTTADSQKKLLLDIAESLKSSHKDLEKEKETILSQEKKVFSLFVSLAIIGIIFIIVGGYLAMNDKLVIGILSELLGILSGSGSALLKYLHKHLAERRKSVTINQKEQTDVLQAIQAALVIPGQAGIDEMKKVAAWLRDTATRSTAKKAQI